jgi:hypothetical protein
MSQAVESFVRLLELWWGLDELGATAVVGVVIGCVAFSTVSLLVVLFRGSARKTGQSCMHALLCSSAALDLESGKARSEPPGAERENKSKPKSKTARVGAVIEEDDDEGEERADGEACPGGGYRSGSSSDSEGEGQRLERVAQRRSRGRGCV